jgi:hypothetical protein
VFSGKTLDETESRGKMNGTVISLRSKVAMLVRSRKFWAAFVGLGVVIGQGLDPKFPLQADMTTNIVYLLVAYILGTGIEDSARAKAN